MRAPLHINAKHMQYLRSIGKVCPMRQNGDLWVNYVLRTAKENAKMGSFDLKRDN